MTEPHIEVVMAEFGPGRANAGDAALPSDRLEPSLSSFRRHFPEAMFTVYTDQPWPNTDQYRVVQVTDHPFDRSHPRLGNRLNDYFQPVGLLASRADVAIAVDSDLVIVSEDIRTLIPMVRKLSPGVAAAVNGRSLTWRDARAVDGGPVDDESRGCGMCHATALIAFDTANQLGRKLLAEYAAQTELAARTNTGARGPVTFWRATWEAGIAPITLPREFCLTASSLGDSEVAGRVVPVCIHAGHALAMQHYDKLVKTHSAKGGG